MTLMINFIQISQDTYIMNIQERDVLSDIGKQFDNNAKPTQTDRQNYYDAFVKYLDCVIQYCQTELKGKMYSYNHIIPQIFVYGIKSEQAFKQYWRCSLYCAQLYLQFLKSYIQICYLERYETLRWNLICDIELLLAQYEKYNKNFSGNIELSCGARKDVSTLDMLFVLRDLSFLENIPSIKDISLRDIKPYQMFVMRQILEKIGKNAIGYDQIVDKNGKIVPKFTQISWEFLNEYSKCTSWRISTPISISSIHLLNKWANSFVHSGFIYASYIQYYAFLIINKLMQGPKNPVTCYNGKKHLSTLYGDFRIEKYNLLKCDFEKYINSKSASRKCILHFFRKKKNEVFVKWKKVDDVGAYVLSL